MPSDLTSPDRRQELERLTAVFSQAGARIAALGRAMEAAADRLLGLDLPDLDYHRNTKKEPKP